MAKVSGPLHSLTATGSIGGTLTMLRQMQRNIAKKKSKPGGAPSAAQFARRAFYKQAASDWVALSLALRLLHKPAADEARITVFNQYMRTRLVEYIPGELVPWDSGTAVWDSGSAVWI